MISIIEHIEYLVLRHDCVVVPGLGALIAHHTPAYIDEELGCIFPPRRSMTFNPELTHNDGLLVSSVARRHRLTYDQAVQVVTDAVNAMRYQLRQEGETGIGHLGVLTLTTEGTPIFEPFESASVAPRYMGLSAVKAIPLSLSGMPTAHATEDDSAAGYEEASAINHTSVGRGVLQIAAAMVALVMLGLMLSTPTIDHQAMRASMAPAIERVKGKSALEETEALNARTRNLHLAIAIPDTTTTAATATPRTIAKTTTSDISTTGMRCNSSDRYFLIVASLPSAYKATEYIAEHPYGNEMHMLESDGRFRIYVATGNTFEAAQKAMSTPGFADRYPQAWVCRP